MQIKILSKLGLLLIVILSGLTLFVSLVFYFFPTIFFQNKENTEMANLESPIRIKIPSINLDANIESLGLTPSGAMDVPKVPSDVAWFNLGPIPGKIGSSVIAGHYGWKNNIPAVFDNLNKINIGDKIYIQNKKGETIIFIVRKIKTYNKNNNDPNIFISTDGKSHLNLITCAGDWDPEEKTFSERLIIFSDKE